MALGVLLLAAPLDARSQGPARIESGGNIQVGGEVERYLRVLELAGIAAPQPWTIRPVVAPSLTGDHPWKEHWSADTSSRTQFTWRWLRPAASAAVNTSFPYQVLPAPAWTGRGFTLQAAGGITASWGRFNAHIEPTAFAAQNASFDLAPNGLTGDAALREPRFPFQIDAPQRFGTGTYARVEPGNTTLSLDLAPVVVGLGSAAESWGPAREFPLVLSANSAGLKHAFVGTSRPVDLWFAKLHARVIAGALDRSPVAAPATNPNRWLTALAVTFLPRGVDGLELGASRVVEGLSATGIPTFANLARLAARGLRASLNTPDADNKGDENQLASAWFRWHVPRTSTEFYGEYYREDYALDLRWFLQYPDDLGTYVLGLQHVRDRGAGRLRAYRFEIVNGEISSSNKRQRPADPDSGRTTLPFSPQPPYLHGGIHYGHTNRGFILGSPEAFGGAAWRVGIDDYDARGRQSLTIERQLRLDWLPGTSTKAPPSPDVIYAVRAERFRFVGGREIGITLVPMLDLNRNLRRGNDQFNLAAALSVRGLR